VSAALPGALASYFETDPPEFDLGTNLNVAPTNDVYGVIEGADHRRLLRPFEWGLIPSWAKEAKIANHPINARAETVADKPAFRSSFAHRRCLVPMSGFYEWRPGDPAGPLTSRGVPVKQPFLIERADHQLLAVAGLWSAWRPPGCPESTPWRHTCTVITTDANATVRPVHDRMPVLLDRHDWQEWLDPGNPDTASLVSLLRPAPEDLLQVRPVSPEVNSVRNRGPFW